jgi:hypothetical protein
LNTTSAAQLAPALSVAVQLVAVIAKSPDAVTVSPASAVPPGFENVTVWLVLVPPTLVAGKLNDAGDTLREAAATPVPVTGTITAATPRLVLLIVTTPFWLPATWGANVTGAPQLAPAASVVPQLPDPTP